MRMNIVNHHAAGHNGEERSLVGRGRIVYAHVLWLELGGAGVGVAGLVNLVGGTKMNFNSLSAAAAARYPLRRLMYRWSASGVSRASRTGSGRKVVCCH